MKKSEIYAFGAMCVAWVGIEVWLYGQMKYDQGLRDYANGLSKELTIMRDELYEKYGLNEEEA